MPQSALRQMPTQSAEPVVRSYNPFNPAFRDTVRSGINELIGGREMGGTPTQRYRAGMADMLTGAVDFAPGIGDAVGVADTVQAARGGNYGTAAMLGGATMLGMLPVVGDAASKAIRGGLDMSQAARMQRAQEQGYTGPFYHGSGRIDRVVESGKIDPRRATSGPMPYFTDSPELASSYATGKQDTSLPEGQLPEFFRVSPKDIGLSGRSPIPVERSWYFLSPEVKADIREKALRVGFENLDESSGKLMLHPSGVEASPSRMQYEYLMKTTARGNPLAALRELWAESGILYGNEEKLADVYRLAGFPARIDQSAAPWTEASGVLPAMLRISNPLVTENTDELANRVIPALREAFKNDRTRLKQFGADAWDKNTRYPPKQWVEELAKDVSEGSNSYVWTSIPDKVTNALEGLGYDGILDVSGKGGGTQAIVAIPFRPDQVRSVNAAFDPAKRGSPNIMAGAASATIGLSALRNIQREEEPQPD